MIDDPDSVLGESEEDEDGAFNLSMDSFFVPSTPTSLYVPTTPTRRATPQRRGTGRGRATPKALSTLFKPEFQCSLCGKTYKTKTGLANHVATHRCEAALSRLPSSTELIGHCTREGGVVAKDIVFEPIGDSEEGANFVKFATEVAENVSPPSDAFVDFAKSVSSALKDVPAALKKDRKLLKGSMMTAVRTALHLALIDSDTRNEWTTALDAVTAKPALPGVPEQYLQLFCRLLKDRAVRFIVECMRETAVDNHAVQRTTLSADNYESLFSRQTLHHVLGAAVRSLLKRCRQYPRNKKYQMFKTAILENLTVISPSVSNPLSDSYWTQLINRKSLLFLSEKTVNVFCEVAKIICYSETANGCLYREDILSAVFSSPSLLLSWEEVVGGNLTQDLAFDLLRMLTLSLCGTFRKGILLRRMNEATESKTASVMNVGIRAKVTR